jgi:hypothetical protein
MTPSELRSLIEKRILVEFSRRDSDNRLSCPTSPKFGPYLSVAVDLASGQIVVLDDLGEEFVLATLHGGRWQVNDGLDEGRTFEWVQFYSHNTIDGPESEK